MSHRHLGPMPRGRARGAEGEDGGSAERWRSCVRRMGALIASERGQEAGAASPGEGVAKNGWVKL